ncbi:MAG: CoA transferase [Chloroflexi bacterium]|nr:CoA transferase [Chloroflexota bacterium]
MPDDKPQFLLDGVRVVDATRNVAGPFCSMILGDLGAEVIKIEEPGKGDELRTIRTYAGRRTDDQDYFYTFNRNKKSLAVNLRAAEGVEIVRRLVAQADVFLENYAPGALRRLGLGPEDLFAVKPDLIYGSVSGFGQSGTHRQRKAYDTVVQAMSGLMTLNAPPGGPPLRTAIAIADLAAALYMAIAVVSALFGRERGGRGQHIDLAMLDAVLALLAINASEYLTTGKPPAPTGNPSINRAPAGVYLAADGRYLYFTSNDRVWPALCSVLERPGLLDEPRFATNRDRLQHRAAIEALVAEIIRERPAGQWEERLAAQGIPCSTVLTLPDAFRSAYAQERGVVTCAEHPISGPVPVIASPMRFSAASTTPRLPAPLLGQHTEEILAALGYSSADVQRLREREVI